MAELIRLNQHDVVPAEVLDGASCAFGVFDGVHLGHRFIIDRAIAQARRNGEKAVSLTFDIDPDEVFAAEKLRKIMSNEQRFEALLDTGVDTVVVFAFTHDFASNTPDDFLAKSFGGAHPASIHVGVDFRFGSHASGTIDTLREWGDEHGVLIDGCELLQKEGKPVTATRIRGLLGEGKVEEASKLLGHPYRLTGTVKPGRGEGRDMGFRTANLFVPTQMRVLGEGVYAAYSNVEGKRYKAAVSVGVSPTFEGQTTATCEIHLLDFDDDIYDQTIAVDFIEWLRPMMKFDSVDELARTVMGNIEYVRENL